MIFEELEFHNVDHLSPAARLPGLRIERFPESMRHELGIYGNWNARFRVSRAHGCEIRFVTEAPYFDVTLMAVEHDVDIIVYRGDMMHEKHTLRAGALTVLHVEHPPVYRQVDEDRLPRGRFAPNVWRIQLGMNGYVHFCGLDTFGFARRPPEAGEKPGVSWAAYGSSITCGSVTTLYSNSYIEQAALRLGWDVMNKGLSGSCMCEEAIAGYLAGLDVQALSLEVGVNMRVPFEEEAFRARVRRLFETVREKSRARRVYCIDIFANRAPILLDRQSGQYRHEEPFREIVRELVKETDDSRFVHIDGRAIARNLTYLSTDLLHPSDQGHILMGQNLAEIIGADWTKEEIG